MASAKSHKYEALPHVEDLEEYRSGGFHPVLLGDKLKDDRYRILNKIGHGTFCTVWLAEDTTSQNCVAVSVQRASDSQGDNETHNIKILKQLSRGSPYYIGRPQVLLPQDTFDLSGPNGQHFCIVTPVQGQSLSMVTKRKSSPLSEVLPLPNAKRAALDTMKAFAYIHKHGIVHGDLHPGNILLSLSGAEAWNVDKMEALYGPPRITPIRRIDRTPLGDSVPRYAVEEALGRLSNISLYNGALKVADFGCAFTVDNPPKEIDFFGPYIVPEQYSSKYLGPPSDIWTLGCAIYLLLSGRDLFGIPDDSAGMVFSKMTELLGEPPEFILQSWEKRSHQDLIVTDVPLLSLASRVQDMRDGNEALRMKKRHEEFSDHDISLVKDLLTSMLRYDPAERPTIEALLQHPCIKFFEGNT